MNARHLMDWLVEKENVVAKKLAGLQVRKNYRVLKEPSRAQIDKSCALADHARLSCRMLAFRMSNRFPAASCLPYRLTRARSLDRDEAGCNDMITSRIHALAHAYYVSSRPHRPSTGLWTS